MDDYANTNINTTNSGSSKFSAKLPKVSFSTKGTTDKLKNMKKNHLLIGGIIVALVVTFLAGRNFAPNSTQAAKTGQVEAPTPIATQTLNKTFYFPLTDEKGKQVSRISYTIESANLQNSFIYQGKLATSVKGRTFLIFDLKIKNPYSKTIEINAKDYIRVKLNGSDELLAPEIHNDPVQIQANSTKYTRIGLPLNDTDKNIVIIVGELQGNKETIKLNLEK